MVCLLEAEVYAVCTCLCVAKNGVACGVEGRGRVLMRVPKCMRPLRNEHQQGETGSRAHRLEADVKVEGGWGLVCTQEVHASQGLQAERLAQRGAGQLFQETMAMAPLTLMVLTCFFTSSPSV